MLFFYLTHQVLSISILQPAGDIYIQPSEIYNDNFLTYFSGESMDFNIFPQSAPSPIIYQSNATKLELSSFTAFPSQTTHSSTTSPVIFSNNSNFFILNNQTNLSIFKLIPLTGIIELFKSYSIIQYQENSIISQIVSTQSWIFILVESKIEILNDNYTVHELYYTSLELDIILKFLVNNPILTRKIYY